jgi:ubiquinone/menaquinone biosynthesis C-methylase UbiE
MKVNISFSSFFSNVQEQPWYIEFLEPVVSQIAPYSKVLDIGTGTGKLIQLLINEKNTDCTGIDTSSSMLVEAEKKLKGLAVSLLQVPSGAAFPFQNACFDEICICNVLFNLSADGQKFLLNQSLEVLNNEGRIIILSPTGKGHMKAGFHKLLTRNNKSFALWYILTRRNARKWNAQGRLPDFCKEKNLVYSRRIVFDGFGLLELVEKRKFFINN